MGPAAPCGQPISAKWTGWIPISSFLATVGSVSPYVGLFGTVWGIMLAFRNLSSVAQATLAQVAPGHCRGPDRHRHGPVSRPSLRWWPITAIPTIIDRLSNRMESFMEEFSNILQRQAAKV